MLSAVSEALQPILMQFDAFDAKYYPGKKILKSEIEFIHVFKYGHQTKTSYVHSGVDRYSSGNTHTFAFARFNGHNVDICRHRATPEIQDGA
jgi:hypothetical protein